MYTFIMAKKSNLAVIVKQLQLLTARIGNRLPLFLVFYDSLLRQKLQRELEKGLNYVSGS